jgi:hypothetical protein
MSGFLPVFSPKKVPLSACLILITLMTSGFEQSTVRVEPTDSVGPRVMEKQTETAVVQDYLGAWQSLTRAMQENKADGLDAYFVGVAKEKLADTIREQAKLGIQTRYQDQGHNLHFLFYSPEGLSIQLEDTVEYDVQIVDHDKVQGIQHVHSRYVAVLTPTEVRWKVRIFEEVPE